MSWPLEMARNLIDQSHKRDPAYIERSSFPQKDELAYADAVESWTRKLLPCLKQKDAYTQLSQQVCGLDDLLIIASRCQRLERLTPRSTYLEGKAGYLKCKRDLYTIQADRAKQILVQAGVDEKEADWVRKWVSKTDLKPGKHDGDVGTQLLEDAAILAFLEDELSLFAAQHQEYAEQKFIDIIKKTWRNLSPLGKDEARKLSMPKGLGDLVNKAIGSVEEGSTSAEGPENRKQVSSAAPYTAGFQRAVRPKTAAEAQAMLAASEQDGEEAAEFFGARLLKDEEGDSVWQHNAWDHVTPPAEHLAMVEELLAKQAETKLTLDQADEFHSKPASYWDTFYSSHSNRFFKDRRWLHLEFPELVEATLEGATPTTILEVGCGAGNTVFPLLEINKNPNLTIHACDYSSEAVNVVRANPLCSSPPHGKCFADVWDLSSSNEGEPNLPPHIEPGTVDIVVLIFVLSALHPREWAQAVRNVKDMLKPNGLVLLRDYGRHDLPQLRFKKRRMLQDNFYYGTRVYFFTPEELIDIFDSTPAPPERELDELLPRQEAPVMAAKTTEQSSKAFNTEQMAIDRRLLVNRKERKRMYRVWMQAKFRLR